MRQDFHRVELDIDFPTSAHDKSLGPVSVLIVGLNYAPEPSGNAPYTTKLAEGLAARGHVVNVLTGYPHYPSWRVPQGYRGLSMVEIINGIRVQRVRHTVPESPRALNRLLMEASFGLHSILRRWDEPDIVLVVSPGLIASAFAVLKARILRRRVVIWVQDLYSRGIQETSGGNGFLVKGAKFLESVVLNGCEAVTVIHNRFKSYVERELRVPPRKVVVNRNWTHITYRSGFDRAAVRKHLGWNESETIALHAGNMGAKQRLENVVEAARLSDRFSSDVRFVLLGDGNQRERLELAADGVASITFLRSLDDREYAEALLAADVLVVNEGAEVREMSVPSKLTSYFSAGIPVVAATHSESVTAEEIRQSGGGVVVDPERPSSLLRAVEALSSDPERSETLGAAGLRYAQDVLSDEAAIGAYSRWLTDVCLAEELQ